MLGEGQADAALIPVIEYQRVPGLKISPGACVASLKTVRSVVLASRVPLKDIRSVALDTSSRTSAALIQIILSRFHSIAPSYRSWAPDLTAMLESNDAALMIGDPAMLIDRSALHVYDLAEEWRNHTGLPFVFAFWAIRNDSKVWPGAVDFIKGKDEGVAHVDDIADEYSSTLGLPREDLVSYLTENISYELDEESLRGLSLYFDLAKECGLISKVTELEFLE